MVGFFYPTQTTLGSGAYTSSYPDLVYPVLTLNVYQGDLGIDEGTPTSVYTLDPSTMEQLTGGSTGVDSLELMPGDTVDLPNGLGTITFENADPDASDDDFSHSVSRFASFDIHNDPSQGWVLVFAILIVGGLLLSLFVPRRRMWVKATTEGRTIRIEYAALARGEDPTLAAAVDQVAQRHGDALEDAVAAFADKHAGTAEESADDPANPPT